MKTTDELKGWLRTYMQRNFGIDVGTLDVDPLSLGIDSMESVILVAELEKWLEDDLPMSLLWDAKNIEEFLSQVVEHMERDRTQPKIVEARKHPEFEHPFGRYVNPYLARRLQQLKMDKVFVRGEGCYLYDRDGRRYLDFMAQYGALPFGHNPREIWSALETLQEDLEPSFVQPSFLASAGELASRLIALSPSGLAYVTFANSGAEAIEVAIKLCRHATGRPNILSTIGGFHGKTMGALSATGNADYQEPFRLPVPGFNYIPYGDAEALEQELRHNPGVYAAFMVEPIQGEGGVVEPPAGYLRRAKQLCGDHGVLLVVDEVQTGLGRTGSLFACEDAGVVPDVLTLAKALGGGLVPIGACLCKAAVYSEKFGFKHSSTFAGNALAARAGLATLNLLERDNRRLLQQVSANGAELKARLVEIQRRYPQLIKGVSGRGYMLGVHFGVRRDQWPESFLGIAAEQKEITQFVSSYLLNVEGIRLAPTLNSSEVLRIQPPLNATWEQCMQVAEAIERTMEVLANGDTGLFYRSILERRQPEALPDAQGTASIRRARQADDAVFAFLMHPLDSRSYSDYDRSLVALSRAELREFSDSMDGLVDPFVGSSVRLVSKTGATARGDFILLSRTAEGLMAMSSEDALEELRLAVALAQRRGAKIIGLGAYSSVVSRGGLKLMDCGVPLTSGNSYTVVAGYDALGLAVKKSGRRLESTIAGVVGAGGAIGSSVAVLLAEQVDKLILIGNPLRGEVQGRMKLLHVAARVCQHLHGEIVRGRRFTAETLAGRLQSMDGLPTPGAGLEAYVALAERLEQDFGSLVLTNSREVLAHADVVVAATSFPGAVLLPAHLKRWAIVCDISRPRAIPDSIQTDRPDILVIDGGVIAVPGKPDIGPYGLATGEAYACMAETMMLTLERRFEHMSLGADLKIEEILTQRRLAVKHGFSVAGLQSYGRPLSEADWQRFTAAIPSADRRVAAIARPTLPSSPAFAGAGSKLPRFSRMGPSLDPPRPKGEEAFLPAACK